MVSVMDARSNFEVSERISCFLISEYGSLTGVGKATVEWVNAVICNAAVYDGGENHA